MPTPQQYPNFVRGIAAAGVADLRALAGTFADWQLVAGARIDGVSDDPSALAAELLAKLAYPEHVFDPLSPAGQDRVAAAIGLPARADWVSPPVPSGTPDYLAPSWEKDVFAVLFLRAEPPAVPLRQDPPRLSHIADWPELKSMAAWRRSADGAGVAADLAVALGKGWEPAAPVGTVAGLPAIRSRTLGIDLVAIPGGAFTMGLSPEERTALAGLVKGRGAEAAEHVRALTAVSRPVRRVTVEPFLIAAAPLAAGAAPRLGVEGDDANPHRVLRLGSSEAATAVAGAAMRLPSEAEWEWVARAAGSRVMLSGDADPDAWVEQTLGTPLSRLSDPFGVLGLGWGEWVDDGWHPSYSKAPKRAVAWDPKVEPELVRGGAFDLWPWQVGGEVVLCHAAARDRAGPGAAHTVRFATDLPARS